MDFNLHLVTHLDGDADSHADEDTYKYNHFDGYAYGHRYLYLHADMDLNVNRYSDLDSDLDLDSNRHMDRDEDLHLDAKPHGDIDLDCHRYPDVKLDTYGYSIANGDDHGNLYRHAKPNRDKHTAANRAQRNFFADGNANARRLGLIDGPCLPQSGPRENGI